jgi:hypothetical protein
MRLSLFAGLAVLQAGPVLAEPSLRCRSVAEAV